MDDARHGSPPRGPRARLLLPAGSSSSAATTTLRTPPPAPPAFPGRGFLGLGRPGTPPSLAPRPHPPPRRAPRAPCGATRPPPALPLAAALPVCPAGPVLTGLPLLRVAMPASSSPPPLPPPLPSPLARRGAAELSHLQRRAWEEARRRRARAAGAGPAAASQAVVILRTELEAWEALERADGDRADGSLLFFLDGVPLREDGGSGVALRPKTSGAPVPSTTLVVKTPIPTVGQSIPIGPSDPARRGPRAPDEAAAVGCRTPVRRATPGGRSAARRDARAPPTADGRPDALPAVVGNGASQRSGDARRPPAGAARPRGRIPPPGALRGQRSRGAFAVAVGRRRRPERVVPRAPGPPPGGAADRARLAPLRGWLHPPAPALEPDRMPGGGRAAVRKRRCLRTGGVALERKCRIRFNLIH